MPYCILFVIKKLNHTFKFRFVLVFFVSLPYYPTFPFIRSSFGLV